MMLNLSVEVEIIECATNEKSRILTLEAQFHDMNFIFVNINARNDLAKQVKFFESQE